MSGESVVVWTALAAKALFFRPRAKPRQEIMNRFKAITQQQTATNGRTCCRVAMCLVLCSQID
jgi:hypothetical protein